MLDSRKYPPHTPSEVDLESSKSPQSVPNTGISKTNWEHTLPLWSCGRPSKELGLCTTALYFVPEIEISFDALVRMSFHFVRLRDFFAWSFSHPSNFSVAPAEILGSNNFLNSSMTLSFDLHSRWVHLKYTWSRNEVGSPRSTNFNFFRFFFS